MPRRLSTALNAARRNSPVPSTTATSSSPSGTHLHAQNTNISAVLAGQRLGIEVSTKAFGSLPSSTMISDTSISAEAFQPIDNPFGPRVLPISYVRSVTHQRTWVRVVWGLAATFTERRSVCHRASGDGMHEVEKWCLSCRLSVEVSLHAISFHCSTTALEECGAARGDVGADDVRSLLRPLIGAAWLESAPSNQDRSRGCGQRLAPRARRSGSCCRCRWQRRRHPSEDLNSIVERAISNATLTYLRPLVSSQLSGPEEFYFLSKSRVSTQLFSRQTKPLMLLLIATLKPVPIANTHGAS